MINPATQPSDRLNEFTCKVKSLGDSYPYGWAKSSYWVRLRNGTLVQPEFKAAEDETCVDSFFAEGYRYCWNLDGTSVTRSDYDMMEIVRND